MKEQQGRHTIYRTRQQESAPTQHIAHTTRTTSQRTSEVPTEEPSASPHRAGFTAGLHPEDTPYTSSEQSTRPPASHTTRRPVAAEEAETLDDGAFYPQRRPTSVRRYWPVEEQGQPPQERGHGTHMVQSPTPQTVVRYHQRIPARSSRTTDTQEQHRVIVQDSPTTHTTALHAQPVQTRPRLHWLVYVGVIVLAAVGLYVGSSLFLKWWHVHQDDVTYGRPRTYQCDASVGHTDSIAHPSHFIALNLNKQVEIIEFPGGDATRMRVYIGPTLDGDGQELTPVTLTFRDVNDDGKPDMILHIGDSQIIYINDNGQFRPTKASDHITL